MLLPNDITPARNPNSFDEGGFLINLHFSVNSVSSVVKDLRMVSLRGGQVKFAGALAFLEG